MSLLALELLDSRVHELDLAPNVLAMFPYPVNQVVEPGLFLVLFNKSSEYGFFFRCENACSQRCHQTYLHNDDVFKYDIVVPTIRRVCASEGGAKNLAKEEKRKN